MNLVNIVFALISFPFGVIGARYGWGGGGGNRGHSNGGGRFNGGNWRFSSNRNTQHYSTTSHHPTYHIVRPNSNMWADIINDPYYSNSNSEQEGETIAETEVTQEDSSCVIPRLGDMSKFELRCIPVDSARDVDCHSIGNVLPSGTTAMLRCKPPFQNENGETRWWSCEDGSWKGELKGITCIYETDLDDSKLIEEFQEQFGSGKKEQPNHVWGNLFPSVFDNKREPERPSGEDNKGWVPTTTTTTTIRTTTTTRPTTTRTTTMTTTTPTTTTPTTTTTTATTTTTTTTTEKPAIDWRISGESVKCPPLSKRVGVELQCISKMPLPHKPSAFVVSEDECETPQEIGSDATYKCQKYYEATSNLKTLYRKCKSDGTWSGSADLFSCTLECGVSNPVGQIPLITHGEPTYKSQWPWHASLFFRKNREDNVYDYNCGGTLINKKVVLTAAHCVVKDRSATLRDLSMFRIDLGRYERIVDDEHVQKFSVEEIIVHPDYNPNSYDSDIAIIILKEQVSIGYHVRPICYPQQQNTAFEELLLASGSMGTVAGFGKNENNVEADILHMAKLRVISSKECALSFSDTSFGASLAKSTTFCAGLRNGTNVCSGDSGGGIFFPSTSILGTKWYLMGLVSVGVSTGEGKERKCDPTRYSVFTKISPYADWIGRIISTQYDSYY